MVGLSRAVMGAAVIGMAVAMVPTASEAAWWPWSKRERQAQPPADQPVQVAPPADDGGQAGDAQSADRLARIEAQMRSLTGQIEELNHEIAELQQQLQQVQGDADFRLRQLEGGKGAQRKAAAAPAPTADESTGGVIAVARQPAPPAPAEPPPGVADAAPGAVEQLGAPPRPLGTLTPDQAASAEQGGPIELTPVPRVSNDAAGGAPVEPSPAVQASAPQPTIMASLGDPRADYERAYNDILAGDYVQAEQAFRTFLSAHPDDDRAADAQYWLGESLFERGKYRDAANEFLNGHKAYPKSDKGPDTLLKLGLSLAGLGEREAACSTYAEVLKQYPHASNALKMRVSNEQASASC